MLGWFWKIWEKASILKRIYIISAGIIALALLVLFVGLYWEIYLFAWTRTLPANTTIQNLALAFLGTVSGFGALFGVFLAIRRTEEAKRQSDADERKAYTAEQGLAIDRLNKANEGLGRNDDRGPVIEIRLGALYALERIAQDSLRDHIQIMEILCSYIRTNSPYIEGKKAPRLREDIQTALTIIGRRGSWTKDEAHLKKEKEQKYRPDLSECELTGATLNRANLRGARFYKTNLSNVTFDNADLSNAWFEEAVLNGTWFDRAKTARAWAFKCNFLKCRKLTQEQLDTMFCGKEAEISDDFKRPDHWSETSEFSDFQDAYHKWETKQDDSYLA